MTLDINIGDGTDALTQNQLTDALDGTYWSSGWDATTGSGDYEVDIESGEGAYEGSTVETGSTETVGLEDDVDADDPRKVVIYVDEDENVEYEVGDAVAADPDDETRFRTWDPAPPADVDGVVVAEVWLGADASEVVSDDIRDRRVRNQAAADVGGYSLSAKGYEDVEGDRSAGTEYTNDTGNPLEVRITVGNAVNSTSEGYARLQVGTSYISSPDFELPDFGGFSLSAIVPDGETYELRLDDNGNREVDDWFEQELTVE